MTELDWDGLHERAAALARDEYAAAASDLMRLTRREVHELLERASVDHAKLAELMQVVSSSTLSNQEKARVLRTTAGLAELAVALIARLV